MLGIQNMAMPATPAKKAAPPLSRSVQATPNATGIIDHQGRKNSAIDERNAMSMMEMVVRIDQGKTVMVYLY